MIGKQPSKEEIKRVLADYCEDYPRWAVMACWGAMGQMNCMMVSRQRLKIWKQAESLTSGNNGRRSRKRGRYFFVCVKLWLLTIKVFEC